MTTHPDQIYTLNLDAVTRAIANLVANPIHEHFPGYIAILRAKRQNNGQSAKSSDITDFYDRYLLAERAPSKSPYLRPFKSRGKGLELFNANVAGSYAPSSLRSQGKLISVIDVQGAGLGASYDLRKAHASAALASLLKGHRVPALSLAVFLYRDYGFRLEQPQVARVLQIFRDEFGLRPGIPDEQAVFATVFEDDASHFQDADLKPHVTSGG